MWTLISLTRDQTCIPAVKAWSLNHWATRQTSKVVYFLHSKLSVVGEMCVLCVYVYDTEKVLTSLKIIKKNFRVLVSYATSTFLVCQNFPRLIFSQEIII